MTEKTSTDPTGQSFVDILNIAKAIGNEKRLQILITLQTGPKSFDALKHETQLKKTALSNHLAILIEQELIKKPEHGKYQLTEDGKIFLQAIQTAYNKSGRWKKSQISMQTHQSSAPFIDALFSKKG
ncbi:MAG: winged helix-turn-helix domain-containing protein [Candidatus Bathyarchaeota archaeon]|nr:winged helix-turn-helix domain-containing protein [Candidatus Bathyarchaeota archaeon]